MIKPLSISLTNNNIHTNDYPDALAVKQIDTPVTRQLQAITLHQFDLTFCSQALAEIAGLNQIKDKVIIEGLWISAITRYFKCFTSSESRSQLSAGKVLKTHTNANLVFEYFNDLRNKHIIHDENPFTQAFTGVVINDLAAQHKVADIISLAFNAFTVDDTHLAQLTQLVEITLKWVNEKRDELHNIIGREYEQWSHHELLVLPNIKYTAPSSDVVGVKR